MLIAFLALLGVDLAVLVAIAAAVLARKRWVKRRSGVFRGAIRVADGEVDGLSRKWRRGYGRWVRDILVWTKGPLLFRNEIVVADGRGERQASAGEVKRLGERPIVDVISVDGATVEVAADDGDAELLRAGHRRPAA